MALPFIHEYEVFRIFAWREDVPEEVFVYSWKDDSSIIPSWEKRNEYTAATVLATDFFFTEPVEQVQNGEQLYDVRFAFHSRPKYNVSLSFFGKPSEFGEFETSPNIFINMVPELPAEARVHIPSETKTFSKSGLVLKYKCASGKIIMQRQMIQQRRVYYIPWVYYYDSVRRSLIEQDYDESFRKMTVPVFSSVVNPLVYKPGLLSEDITPVWATIPLQDYVNRGVIIEEAKLFQDPSSVFKDVFPNDLLDKQTVSQDLVTRIVGEINDSGKELRIYPPLDWFVRSSTMFSGRLEEFPEVVSGWKGVQLGAKIVLRASGMTSCSFSAQSWNIIWGLGYNNTTQKYEEWSGTTYLDALARNSLKTSSTRLESFSLYDPELDVSPVWVDVPLYKIKNLSDVRVSFTAITKNVAPYPYISGSGIKWRFLNDTTIRIYPEKELTNRLLGNDPDSPEVSYFQIVGTLRIIGEWEEGESGCERWNPPLPEQPTEPEEPPNNQQPPVLPPPGTEEEIEQTITTLVNEKLVDTSKIEDTIKAVGTKWSPKSGLVSSVRTGMELSTSSMVSRTFKQELKRTLGVNISVNALFGKLPSLSKMFEDITLKVQASIFDVSKLPVLRLKGEFTKLMEQPLRAASSFHLTPLVHQIKIAYEKGDKEVAKQGMEFLSKYHFTDMEEFFDDLPLPPIEQVDMKIVSMMKHAYADKAPPLELKHELKRNINDAAKNAGSLTPEQIEQQYGAGFTEYMTRAKDNEEKRKQGLAVMADKKWVNPDQKWVNPDHSIQTLKEDPEIGFSIVKQVEGASAGDPKEMDKGAPPAPEAELKNTETESPKYEFQLWEDIKFLNARGGFDSSFWSSTPEYSPRAPFDIEAYRNGTFRKEQE